jgi:DNA-binding beta-propeller fold protein YncE/4-amino-4-deoxy-L-arabinose transferase-like glycosyltransferase
MARWIRLILALAIAFWAQSVVAESQHPLDGLLLFGAAAILFVANAPAPREDIPVRAEPMPLLRRRWGLAALGVAGVAVAAVLFWVRLSSPPGLALWLGGLALFLVALWPALPNSPQPSNPDLSRRLELLFLACILLTALTARVTGLGTIPNGLQSDEGNNGLEALKWLSGAPYSPYAEANEGQATLFTYLIALSFKLFGVGVPSMRLVSAVAGTLTVIAFYALAREFHGPRAALAGAALLAGSRWHLTFSRIIYELILVPLVAIWLFYFLHRGLQGRRRRDLVLAGYALALGFNTYTAFRTIPLGVALLGLYWLIRRRNQIGAALRDLGLLALSGLMGLVPLAIYALQKPTVFLGRTRHISVFHDIEQAGGLDPLWSNFKNYLLMFNVQGDGASLNNLPGAPMLGLIAGALFVLGLAYALRHWRRPRAFLPLAWAAGVLPAGVLSVAHEAPSARRVIGLAPVVYLLAAAAVDALWRAGLEAWRGRGRRVWAVGFGALAVVAGASGIAAYFGKQAHHPQVWRAFSPAEAAIGRYIADLHGPAQLYLTPTFNQHSAITFIAADPAYEELDLTQHLPVRRPQPIEVIYVLESVDRRLEPLFHQFYPNGVWKEHLDPYGGRLFNTFAVTPEGQAEALGLNARYYANPSWQSPAALTRRDSAIAFDWRNDAPLPAPFSVEWNSALRVPHYGPYALTIRAGGPFTLTLDGEVLLSGDAGTHTHRGTLIGGFHDLRLRYVAQGDGGGPVLLWNGPRGGEQVVPPAAFFTFQVPPFGLVGSYYPNPNWQGTPAVVQRDIFLTAGEVLPSPYSIIWRGKLLAEKGGLYKLGTNSDDGSLLFVDGQLVVDNGGAHGARYVEGSVHLTAGYHDLELRYFQDGGSRALDLWLTPPEGGKELIPPTALFPQEGQAPVQPPAGPPETETAPPGRVADRFWREWADPEAGMQPRGVAVSPIDGRVYAADAAVGRIQVFDAEGKPLFAFGEEELDEPGDLAVDSRGNVFVLDPLRDSVVRFSGEGAFEGRFREALRLFRPRGIGIDAADRLYVADTGGGRVVILTPSGELLASWGQAGSGPGQFDQPTDVAIAPNGHVYVADTFNGRVQWLDADGVYLGEWPILPANTYDAPHLAVSPGNVLYLTGPEEAQMLAYDLGGAFLGQIGGRGSEPGQLLKPVGVAVDGAGRLYVADPVQGRVQGWSTEKSTD